MGLNKLSKTLALFAVVGAYASVATAEVKWSGDVRYRLNHQWGSDQFSNGTAGANTSNNIRARLMAKGDFSETISGVARIVTSSNPLSNTAGIGASSTGRMTPVFDAAYINYKPSDALWARVGLQNSPFFYAGGHEVLHAGEMSLGGLALAYMGDMGAMKLFGNVGYMQLADTFSATVKHDTYLTGVQLGMDYPMGDMGLKLAAAMYMTDTLATTSAASIGRGLANNSASSKEYKGTAVDLEFGFGAMGLPLKLYGTYITNSEATDKKSANLIGLMVGKTKEAGSWAASVDTRMVERDSIIGGLADATFAGGGTNTSGVSGHRLMAHYMISDNFKTTLYVSGAETTDYTNTTSYTEDGKGRLDRYYLQFEGSF